MNQEKRFTVLTDTAANDFNQAIDIYLDSFQANERQTIDEVKNRIQRNIYMMIVMKNKEAVIGFSLIHPFKNQKFGLLDYLAVKKEYRNRKIGSLLFTYSYNELMRIYPEIKFMVIEVDDPEYSDSDEKISRVNRIKFYEKLGARIIHKFKYNMPPMISEAKPSNMRLMVYGNHGNTRLESHRLKEILISLYKQNYNRGEDDSYLLEMLSSLNVKTFTLGNYNSINLSREE